MRQFILQILAITTVGTALAIMLGQSFQGRPPAQPVSDAGDLSWQCYEERLKVTSRQPIRGWGQLCIGERSVKAVVDAADLQPGEIYTIWLAYIDTPGACTDTPCSMQDFPRLERAPMIQKLDVAIAGDTRQATLSCTLRGVAFAQGAQIQLLLTAHGPAIVGDGRTRQILGTRWPERYWDEVTREGVVARSHFTMLWHGD